MCRNSKAGAVCRGADVQYADKDTAMGRYYRAGIDGLGGF
jgi:hypothetical protein